MGLAVAEAGSEQTAAKGAATLKTKTGARSVPPRVVSCCAGGDYERERETENVPYPRVGVR